MVIIQSTGDPMLVTEARIQIIRGIIDANNVISEDVAREIRRIDNNAGILLRSKNYKRLITTRTFPQRIKQKKRPRKLENLRL